MDPIVKIEAGEFARNALRLHAEGLMGFQNPELRKTHQCSYVYDTGHRCAIGAGFPAHAARAVEDFCSAIGTEGSIRNLIEENHVVEITSTVLDRNEMVEILVRIQDRHDWMMRSMITENQMWRTEDEMLLQLRRLAALHPQKS